MSIEGDQFWTHTGISEIKEYDSRQVRIPDGLFREEDIIELGDDIRWYYHKVTDVIIISKNYLEKDEYEFVDSSSFSGGDSDYKATVPGKFFEDYEGRGGPKAQPRVSEEVNLPKEGQLHFMYHDGMDEGSKKSAYVLTESQFNERFDDSDLSGVPRFS
ncbi:MAG: hypothetical protein ABEJ95_04330 [Candidatus Nanohalobium sp.]